MCGVLWVARERDNAHRERVTEIKAPERIAKGRLDLKPTRSNPIL
jgi:hypothetical protein